MPKQEATGLRAVFLRELKRMAASRFYLWLMIVFPLLSFALLWATFQQQIPRNLPVAVYDADHSALSRQLTRMLDATSTLFVADVATDVETGKKFILEKKAYALIVFPLDFERDIKTGKSSPVVCFYNAQYLLAGSLVARAVRNVTTAASTTLNLRNRQKRGEMEPAAVIHTEAIRADMHGLFNPHLNYVYYLVNTLLPTMLQIFVLMVSVYALGIELKDGTAGEWFDAAGGNTLKAVAGKLLPHTLCFLCIGLFMNTLLFRFLDVPLRGSAAVIMLSTALFVCAYQSLALFFVAVTANMRLALSFSAFYAAPAFAFVGITFPTIGMPLPGKIWSSLLPLSHYLSILVDQSLGGAPVSLSLPSMAMLTAFILIPSTAVMVRFRKLMTVNTNWGRS